MVMEEPSSSQDEADPVAIMWTDLLLQQIEVSIIIIY